MGVPRLLLPEAPALVAGLGHATILTPDGELDTVSAADLPRRLADLPPPLLVHAPATARRLGLQVAIGLLHGAGAAGVLKHLGQHGRQTLVEQFRALAQHLVAQGAADPGDGNTGVR